MINQDRAPRHQQPRVHRLHGGRDPGPAVRHPASLQGARAGRRRSSRLRELFGMLEQEVQRLRRRALQHGGADLLRPLRRAGAPGACRQSAARPARQGHRRRHARAAGRRQPRLEPRAAVLRRRGDDADRGRVGGLARGRDADRHGGAPGPAAAGRRCRGGRSRGRALRSLERRSPPIGRWARSCGRARSPTSRARRAATRPDQERSSTSLRSFRPARKRARLSRKMSKIASFWPSEWLAVWGETSTLGMSHSGEAGSSGSRSNTSR